jgi:hypothetical protein
MDVVCGSDEKRTKRVYGKTEMASVEKSPHPLLKRGEQITDAGFIWTLNEHDHRIVGKRRGFEVRIYQDDTWAEPYVVSMTAPVTGFVMGFEKLPSAEAAEAAALEMLTDLDGTSPAWREH